MCVMIFLFVSLVPTAARYMEVLGRGVIAINEGGGKVYVGWRMLGTDPADIAFNLYRSTEDRTAVRLNKKPITKSTNWVDRNVNLRQSNSYFVRPVLNGKEQPASAPFILPPNAPVQQYISIPLRTDLSHGAYLVGVGDLDADGEYDYVVKRCSQDIDPSQNTLATDTYKLEGYKKDGTFLWRVDLGWNIRQGIWYSPIIVYDLDGDGRAEVIAKTSETTADLDGDGRTDYRQPNGRILSGPEYFSILDGQTGNELARADWIARGEISEWGDSYGNRVNRNLMCVAYLDGQRPSLIILRGTYTKMYVEAWNWRDGQLKKLWRWTLIGDEGGGFHNIRTGDIDGDSKDEIVNGSIAIDDDGLQMWITGEGHGDRMHMTDIDPERPGLEIWYIQEAPQNNGIHLTDAATGKTIWGISKSIVPGDVGRGLAADIDPKYKGLECWASSGALYNCKGQVIGSKPSQCNMAIWWDGDLLRELLGGTHIDKWDYNNNTTIRLFTAEGAPGPRNAPCGYGDIIGDWREEFWYIHDNKELRIYTTTIPAENRFPTFMHDPDYRISVAGETMGYMQTTQPSFYFGVGMEPATPVLNMKTTLSISR